MRKKSFITLGLLICASPIFAQLGGVDGQLPVPPIGKDIGEISERLGGAFANIDKTSRNSAQQLLKAREKTLNRLLRRNRDIIERDVNGDLARRGEILAQNINDEELEKLKQAGFAIIAKEDIAGLDFSITRLSLPIGIALIAAQEQAKALAPNAQFSADHLHFQSSSTHSAGHSAFAAITIAAQSSAVSNVQVGIIDGAAGPAIKTLGQKGFAKGAPISSDHGSAVASLLKNAGIQRIHVADVYGKDAAGGNALAIAKALGWLTQSGSKIVTISLVGPRNALLDRAIRAARRKGVIIVAAVGNDGPAAPPAYPASYSGVLAITGVDKRGRALIEAGRALHLDYAAPGADVYALNAKGKLIKLRGTSFATPLAAARLAHALAKGGNWRTHMDKEARDLGPKGPDKIYGRGLVCAPCGKKR